MHALLSAACELALVTRLQVPAVLVPPQPHQDRERGPGGGPGGRREPRGRLAGAVSQSCSCGGQLIAKHASATRPTGRCVCVLAINCAGPTCEPWFSYSGLPGSSNQSLIRAAGQCLLVGFSLQSGCHCRSPADGRGHPGFRGGAECRRRLLALHPAAVRCGDKSVGDQKGCVVAFTASR